MMLEILGVCFLLITGLFFLRFFLRLILLLIILPVILIVLIVALPFILLAYLFFGSVRIKKVVGSVRNWTTNDIDAEDEGYSFSSINIRGSSNSTISGGDIIINGRRILCDLCPNRANIVMDDIKRCKDCLRKKDEGRNTDKA